MKPTITINQLYIIGEMTTCMLIVKHDNQRWIWYILLTFIRFPTNWKLDLVINHYLDCSNQQIIGYNESLFSKYSHTCPNWRIFCKVDTSYSMNIELWIWDVLATSIFWCLTLLQNNHLMQVVATIASVILNRSLWQGKVVNMCRLRNRLTDSSQPSHIITTSLWYLGNHWWKFYS